MTASQPLVDRVRRALAGKTPVVEKKMFGGVAFMVRGHLCVSVGHDRIMVRVDPESHDEIVQSSKYCSTMTMKNRRYRGYVRVTNAGVSSKRDLDRFVALALDYNAALPARPSRRRSAKGSPK